MAFEAPEVLGCDQITVGDIVKVRPFVRVPVSSGCALSVQLPVAVPAIVVDIPGEYCAVAFLDCVNVWHAPWDSDRQLHSADRGEIHAANCRCEPCFQAGDASRHAESQGPLSGMIRCARCTCGAESTDVVGEHGRLCRTCAQMEAFPAGSMLD